MKTHATKCMDYLQNYDREKLHPKLYKNIAHIADDIYQLNNIILYGPSGIGKYTTSLDIIRKYSESSLNYEKKMSNTSNGGEYFIKISDIHYEIDCGLLSCNSKILWNDIYKNIVDIILTKKQRVGIILCKNFHEIHSDLLDIFYSYMQTQLIKTVHIKFIILTESVSFIPDNILNRCQIIHMKRPARSTYNKCLKHKLSKTTNLENITNIKDLQVARHTEGISHKYLCDNIIRNIIDSKHTTISKLRENLYDILIYNLNIYECMWYIIRELCKQNKIKKESIPELSIETYKFFLYFNNNYRPIYHLENYVIYLINTIRGYES
jgi:DNA polymerase III delta prime subunit